jgi:glycosyltransferase involved in cell wall biosynthesis
VVVKSPLNAATDLIDPGKNGFIAEASTNSLKNQIINAIEHKDEMKTQSIESAREYDWDRIIPLLEQFYQESL